MGRRDSDQGGGTVSRLPPWFRKKLPAAGTVGGVRGLIDGLGLHTVCDSALCPNLGDCFSRGTATFLIMGDTCTRRCTFCAVAKGAPLPLDPHEPANLAEAAGKLGLRHVVVTSVTRDDLADGGAAHFARTIECLHGAGDGLTVEVLVPDFGGSAESLRTVVAARPEVVNHNLETVPRLYPEVRPEADYARSLELLRLVKKLDDGIVTKSGLMLGLGETRPEVLRVMADLRDAGCDLLTLGQYLAPSAGHHPVVGYVTPDEFREYEDTGREMGFRGVASAPLVRSSFDADRLYALAITPGVTGR